MNPNIAKHRAIGDTIPTVATQDRVAADRTTTATGVATSLWRLARHDAATTATRNDTGFVSRLARRLVLTYTRRGDTIVDFDDGTGFRDAATATTRTYVTLTRHKIATIDLLIRPASLIILRWPRPMVTSTAADIANLLLACQLITTTARCTLAVLSTIQPDDTSTTHSPQVGALLNSAAAARFRHQQRILALPGDGDGDIYSYFAADTDADPALDTWRDTTRPGIRVDILGLATHEATR